MSFGQGFFVNGTVFKTTVNGKTYAMKTLIDSKDSLNLIIKEFDLWNAAQEKITNIYGKQI